MVTLSEKLKHNETIMDLIHLKENFLKSEDFQRWVKASDEAKLRYKEVLKETDFKVSRDLTELNLEKCSV